MRTITLLTVVAIMVTVLAYHFTGEETVPQQPQAVMAQVRAISGLEDQDTLGKLASILQHYQQTSQEKWQQIQRQQARLNKVLTDLESRLRSAEDAIGEPATDAVVSNSVEQTTDMAASNSGRVSEDDLGYWMNETLRIGYWDRDSTTRATEQAIKSLGKVSDVTLEDMQCSESFCRATFAQVNGEQPDIGRLFGKPPFANEGFTIHEPDGRVTFYFTQPGESLEVLRGEAREAARARMELGW